MSALQQEIAALDSALGADAEALLTREVKIAPTLVKYAAANDYVLATRRELAEAAAALMKGAPIEDAAGAGRPGGGPAARNRSGHHPALWSQPLLVSPASRGTVGVARGARRNEIIALGARHRGRHDELLREFSAGQGLRFDILMDIGGFRDMHRHRRCIQILQPFTNLHGFEVPEGLPEAGLQPQYDYAMTQAHEAFVHVRQPGWRKMRRYVLPLGTRTRALFKMDFAEALYIAELRSTPAGHFSYRRIAWEMYQAVSAQAPGACAILSRHRHQ